MIKFGLDFSLEEGLAVLGLMDPLSLGITDSQADVDDVSVVFFLACFNIDKFYRKSEISLLVESVREVSA